MRLSCSSVVSGWKKGGCEDWLRKSGGMPVQEARRWPKAKDLSQGLAESEQIMGGPLCGLLAPPGLVRSGGLAETPKGARPHPAPLPQERELNCGKGGMRPGQTESRLIKVNQAKSRLRRWGGGEVASGQWLVASGWWQIGGQVGGTSRKRRRSCGCATYASFRGYGLAGRESSPIKPNQAESSRIKVNQTQTCGGLRL
jgi:hypothetical protein